MSSKQTEILVITGPRRLDYLTREVPDPGPTDVMVETLCSGISHGTEMNVYRGQAPQWTKTYDRQLRLFVPREADGTDPTPERGYWTSADLHWGYPLAYGYVNVGRVIARGKDVACLHEGDIVYAYKPHETVYVAPAEAVIRLPELPDPSVGVFYSNMTTAYNGVLDADIRIGDTVVVFGQGVVGLLVTQFLQQTAAGQIITVETLPHRQALSKQCGADTVLDPSTRDVARDVRALTNGRGADLVIEVSGSYAALHEAIRTAAPETTVVVMSWYGGVGSALALSDEFHHNRITLKCSQVGGIAPELSATHSRERRGDQILSAFSDLTLEPLISNRIPFEDAARGYELIDCHGDQVTQVVLTY